MKVCDKEQELRAALDQFETCVVSPVVPGESLAWSKAVLCTWQPLEEQIKRQIEHVHRAEYKQIAREDPEMLAKVAQLKEADCSLATSMDRLSSHIGKLAVMGEASEAEEGRLQKIVDLIVSEATAFSTQLRKQEAAVRTWFIEAFNRDRGVGD